MKKLIPAIIAASFIFTLVTGPIQAGQTLKAAGGQVGGGWYLKNAAHIFNLN